ncbi:hypothetical protein SY212_23370 [Ligilactobacillus agilis]|uniref:Uncharacterized protein n=1 Tax=Ligilactobacillus agilis TaxID=1601 RepID=A0A6F9XQ35_9LACO|nr:hypothetical protein [Ligilactobacillus agilis]GET07307.1 hypothetical protein SY212_23370 [Ligilactobacillus agilis]
MRYLEISIAVWIKLFQIALAFAPAIVVANSEFLRTRVAGLIACSTGLFANGNSPIS